MRFATFRHQSGAPQPGVVAGTNVISLAAAGFADMLAVLASGSEGLAKIQNWTYEPAQDAVFALDEITLMAPVPRPPKLICVGLNYHDHAVESNMEIPKVPTIFSKFSNTVIGPGENIVLPKSSSKPDYEAEFAFVIGEGGRHIRAEDWASHVFGYTIVNDVSARDFQMATTQWLMGKSFDTFAPMGPWIVDSSEIGDPHNLDIKMTIGGAVLQHSNTRELIFKVPELIAFLSSVFTLEPGDVISTGTPSGVGFARKPPRFLRPGDECVIEIQNIGELKNPVVAES